MNWHWEALCAAACEIRLFTMALFVCWRSFAFRKVSVIFHCVWIRVYSAELLVKTSGGHWLPTIRVRRMPSVILKPGTSRRRVVSLSPRWLDSRRKDPRGTHWVAGWAPEAVWTFWRRGNPLSSAGIRSPCCPAVVRWVINWKGRGRAKTWSDLTYRLGACLDGRLCTRTRDRIVLWRANKSLKVMPRLKYLTATVTDENRIRRN
jgi:hypothetical protein